MKKTHQKLRKQNTEKLKKHTQRTEETDPAGGAYDAISVRNF